MTLLDSDNGEIVFMGRRVNRAMRCPVCDRDTWCLFDPDREIAICPRVESSRPIGRAGWWHSTGGAIPGAAKFSRPVEERQPLEGAGRMQEQFLRQGGPRLGLLALSLGLSLNSLERLGAGWNGSAWTFPMRDSREDIIGFRTRFEDGRKLAVKGSRSGIFVPSGRRRGASEEVWIVEGPTDCAAMIEMGLNAIGRPACRGAEQEIKRWTMNMNVIVVADADGPGVAGAESLIQILRGSVTSVQMVLPPMNLKDAREVLNHGGCTKEWRALLGDSRNQRNSNGRTT
jgi:5S rRNA maturation endonuclease (ribonuclease M5)